MYVQLRAGNRARLTSDLIDTLARQPANKRLGRDASGLISEERFPSLSRNESSCGYALVGYEKKKKKKRVTIRINEKNRHLWTLRETNNLETFLPYFLKGPIEKKKKKQDSQRRDSPSRSRSGSISRFESAFWRIYSGFVFKKKQKEKRDVEEEKPEVEEKKRKQSIRHAGKANRAAFYSRRGQSKCLLRRRQAR